MTGRMAGPRDASERTVISYDDKKKKKKEKAEKQKGDKGKPGLFSKLKKTLKPSGKETSTTAPPSSLAGQESSGDHKDSQLALVASPPKELTKTEEEAERDKMEFYRAIGYSEDEEGIMFPKEVSGLNFVWYLLCWFIISYSSLWLNSSLPVCGSPDCSLSQKSDLGISWEETVCW